jgi:hypothetical protein
MSSTIPQLVILQSATIYNSTLNSYEMSLEVTSSQNISSNIFVKQRLRTSNNCINDVFAAIASPNQLESLGIGSPTADTSYFLDSQITLITNTAEYMGTILQDILSQLQKLTIDVQLLQTLVPATTYTITPSAITTD